MANKSNKQKRAAKLEKRAHKKKVNKKKVQIKAITGYIKKAQELMNIVASNGEAKVFDSIINSKEIVNDIVNSVKESHYYQVKEVSTLSFIDGLTKNEKTNKENILYVFNYIVNMLNIAKNDAQLAETIVLNMPVVGYFIVEYLKEIEADKK